MISTSTPRALILVSLAAAMFSGCTAGIPPTVTPVFASTAVPAIADTVFVASDAWAPSPGESAELFSVGGGSQATRLTFCLDCQALGAAPSLDRTRILLRRVVADTNGDGLLSDLDRVDLLLVDLARQIEGPFLPDGWSNSGVDWASSGTFLVHTSSPGGGPEDMYQINANAQGNVAILATPSVRERGAKIDPDITQVVYERIEGLEAGKSEIWIFLSSRAQDQVRLTDSGVTGEPLAGTLYLVGSDAGPDYSPDGASVVFRRLTSNAVPGGAWDILTVPATGGTPSLLASGPQFRSNPDWSQEGIVFSEANLNTGGTDVVVIDPGNGARRVLQSFDRGFNADAPRWIAGIAR